MKINSLSVVQSVPEHSENTMAYTLEKYIQFDIILSTKVEKDRHHTF